MSVIRAAVRAIDGLNAVVGRVVAVSLLFLIALVVYEVALRYVFKAPTTWGNEMISFIFAGYILLGGGYTLLHRDHVAMDIVHARLSTRTKAIVDTLTAGFVILYCWILLRETGIMAIEALETGQRAASDWSPPLFPVLLSMPVGAFLILLQAIAKLVRDLHMALTGFELMPGAEPAHEPEMGQ